MEPFIIIIIIIIIFRLMKRRAQSYRDTEHHLPYGIVQCYLPPDTGEHTVL